MDSSFLIIIFIIAVVIWFQFGLLYEAVKFQGKDVSGMLRKFNLPVHDKVLLFFCSEYCDPCRAMYPLIEKLKQDYNQVKTVDVKKNTELAGSLKIRATPTIVIIDNGCIKKVLPGTQSEAKLRALLD